MQRVPDFDLVPHEGDMICAECGEETEFLVSIQGVEAPEEARCRECFGDIRPEYSEAITDFSDLLTLMLEMKSRFMTQDEMHELYGNEEEDSEE